jgi:hypothetical protein
MKQVSLTLMALLCLYTSISAQDRVRPYNDRPESGERSAAGLTVQGDVAVEKLIKDVFIGGNCFEIKNIKYVGAASNIGQFEGGKKSINIEKGVIMTTGDIKTALPPNTKSDYSFSNVDLPQDPDLKTLIKSAQAINDQAIIEFDFTPTANTIQFKFVFASEEYCEYVGSDFNDVFGFFISGPGINGPFTNNAKNIALIPGTNNFVSINNVNHKSYSNYFVNNVHTISPVIACAGITSKGKFLDQIGYDGFTKVLTATASVTPCETYHIKLAIADVRDHSYDSAVFLAANSFNSGNNATVEVNIPSTISADKQTVFEGCDSTAITFTRLGDDVALPATINFKVDNSSTATEGVDFVALPKSVVIPAGEMSYRLPIIVINDKITEADETLVLDVETSCTCEETKVSLRIRDKPNFNINVRDTAFCGNLSVMLNSNVEGKGVGGLQYLWSNGANTPNITVQPGVSSKFTLTVTDGCGAKISDEALVTVAEPPIATLSSPDFQVCRIGMQAKLPIEFKGVPPFNITYIINGKETTQNINTKQTFLPIDTVGFIQLKKVSTGSCPGFVSGATLIKLNPIQLSASTTDLKCFNAKDGSIDLKIAGGGTAPYIFTWSNGDTSEDPKNLAAGTYQVTVTDPNLCKAVVDAKITQPTELKTETRRAISVNCFDLEQGLIEVGAVGGTKPYNYNWANGKFGNTIENLTAGVYQYTVTDQNGCFIENEAQVKADTIAPKSILAEAVSPTCKNQFGAIYIKETIGGVPPYQYKIDSTYGISKIFQKLIPSTYVLTVRGSNGCTVSKPYVVPVYEEPEVSLSPLDTIILPGDSVLIEAVHNVNAANLKSISWDPDYGLDCANCLAVMAQPKTSTVYTITVKDKFGCEATAQSRIKFNYKFNVFIPNILNVGSDYMQNRKLSVYGNARQIKAVNLFTVHDRWGTEIYRSNSMQVNDNREGWDGFYNNQEVQAGTYIYYTELLLYNGEILRQSGDVTVVKD